MRKFIDWPYPDRPKLQQLRMTWREMRREGLGNNFGRLTSGQKTLVLVAFLVGLTLSMFLTRLIVGA